ncbi:MAG TPA: hypothetical protein VM848_04230 [Acidimicrobiia bacterium]|nr:hypothetical protein [Acidimicrobiia bacterium]
MTTTTETPTHRPATSLEEFSLEVFVDRVIDQLQSCGYKINQLENEYYREVRTAIEQPFTDDGPLMAKLLAARAVERVLFGGRDWGQEDPPENGPLGLAIDAYLAAHLPIVKAQEPRWYQGAVLGKAE